MDQKLSLKSANRKASSTTDKQKKKKKKSKKNKSELSPDSCALEIEGEGLTADSGGEQTVRTALSSHSSIFPTMTVEGDSSELIPHTHLERVRSATPFVDVRDLSAGQPVSRTVSENNVDLLTSKVAQTSIKTKSGRKPKTKSPVTPGAKSPVTPGAKPTGAKGPIKGALADPKPTRSVPSAPVDPRPPPPNESLRWDNVEEDPEKESRRLQQYKLNRRKRYLAAAQAKGLAWAVNYSTSSLHLSEDPGFDVGRDQAVASFVDFNPMKSLRPGPSSHNASMVDCL